MSQLLENRYQILRELSEGGFGKTFIAEDTQMPSRRRCVIKQLKPINQGSNIYELIKERFQREAVILEDLGNHSSQIPTLYAHFSSEDKFYLVQEYIEGETLAQRVQKQGKLSESAVREILIKLLPVLEYVHSKRIVHRDIKPENIILRSGDDTPVLIDFGAVREIMGTVMTSSGNSTGSIVIGTPGYMPSEQMIGRPIFASDLYALSLTAIYALTGKIPSELENDPLTGNLAWLEEANTVSPTLATILDKGIETYARDRFATAREMLQALQGQVQTMEVTMPPMVASTIMSAPPTVVNSEFLTQAIPSENNNSIISTPTKTGANNNILMAGIIGLVLLIGFGSLGYFQFQQQQNYQAQMAQLEEEKKKAEEQRLQQEQTNKNQETSLNNNNVFPSQTELNTIDINQAIDAIENLYYFLSAKDFNSASNFYSYQVAEQFDSNFFSQFARVTVENLQIVSQTSSSINFVGYNTYVYPDGSIQKEKRSYTIRESQGDLKVTSSEFIKVTKFR